jgi:glutamate carboxypeptidase
MALLVAGGVSPVSPQTMSSSEAAMVKAVDAEAPAAITLLEKLVNINSGTMNLQGVIAVKDVIEPQIQDLGFKTHWEPMQAVDGRAGDLVAEHPCPGGSGKCARGCCLSGTLIVFEPSSSFQRY